MKVRDLENVLHVYVSIYVMDDFLKCVDLVDKVKYDDIPEEFLDREVRSIGARDARHVDICVK